LSETGMKESLSVNKVRSIAKKFVGIEFLIMRCNNRSYEKQKNVTIKKYIIWPSSAIRKSNRNRYKFDYDNII